MATPCWWRMCSPASVAYVEDATPAQPARADTARSGGVRQPNRFSGFQPLFAASA
jgi:hypothetical protein